MKRIGHALFILALILLLVAVGLAVGAIWTVGPDADRLQSTAFLLAGVAMLHAVFGAIMLEVS